MPHGAPDVLANVQRAELNDEEQEDGTSGPDRSRAGVAVGDAVCALGHESREDGRRVAHIVRLHAHHGRRVRALLEERDVLRVDFEQDQAQVGVGVEERQEALSTRLVEQDGGLWQLLLVRAQKQGRELAGSPLFVFP